MYDRTNANADRRASRMRTRVYSSIVELLSDGRWHWLADIGQLTQYPDDWARELAQDSRFEFDETKSIIRLRAPSTETATS
jgi:hypothetical protein